MSCGRELVAQDDVVLFCSECVAHLGPEAWHGCRRCGAEVLDVGFSPTHCPLCHTTPLKFDAAVVLGGYHKGLQKVVLRMKRPTHNALTIAMGRLLFRQRHQQLTEHPADVVVPIPMYWTRRLGRGINNPDVLANCLGTSLGLPVHRLLVRCLNTRPQAELPPSRRFENMRGAFRVRRPEMVKDARIWLVDDILTTGATCSEAAKMLKRAGAAWVGVAVVARAQGKR
jgi:ComF family protein